jgi:5,10-methylenetetrahydrofolate reductase
MRLTEIWRTKGRPTVSFEFFPPRSAKAAATQDEAIAQLRPLEPVITTARAAARRPRLELLVRGAFDVPEPARVAVGKAISDAGGESVFCAKDNRNCR